MTSQPKPMQRSPHRTVTPHSAERIRIHRSWRSVIPQLLFAFVATSSVLWASIRYDLVGPELPIGSISLLLPVALLVGLVTFARPLLLLLDCKHELGEHHLYSIKGRCSLRREYVEIPFDEMLGVRSRQTLLERILGTGSILIWTASADHADLILDGIADPERHSQMIGARIDHSAVERKQGNKERRHEDR